MIPASLEYFKESLGGQAPPGNWPDALKALWHIYKGEWEASHNIAQELDSQMGSWIHAHLHRREGDRWNAGYWYNRAAKEYPRNSLEEELELLVRANVEEGPL